MNYMDCCYSPGRLDFWFKKPPPLNDFTLMSVDFMTCSPRFSLYGHVPHAPDRKPIDLASFVHFHIGFVFYRLSHFEIQGWSEAATGALAICRPEGESGVEFRFEAPGYSFRGRAESFDIESAGSKFNVDSPTRRVRGLFSHRNVWNSCLIYVASKGFSIEIVGLPDENHGMSNCTWKAQRDNRPELRAETPIELAGLVALHEHAQPQPGVDYWWRLEGPWLTKKASDAWHAKYFGPQHADEWKNHDSTGPP